MRKPGRYQPQGAALLAQAGSGEPIRLYAAYNEQDEARFVVEQIEAWAAAGNPRAEAAIHFAIAAFDAPAPGNGCAV